MFRARCARSTRGRAPWLAAAGRTSAWTRPGCCHQRLLCSALRAGSRQLQSRPSHQGCPATARQSRSHVRGSHIAPAFHRVVGGDRPAIAPDLAAAQLECPAQAIVRNRPVSGSRGDDVHIAVERDQRIGELVGCAGETPCMRRAIATRLEPLQKTRPDTRTSDARTNLIGAQD